ncbi:NAD(P)/FAD-dependent oxidoreductase [Cellulomonas gelida]|uniref:Pyridine nucleotide-disulfide oxidoreductase n=1 Tax=Cellulomonas gelida TaxID=1712 RepID=A0A4Y3KN95_9CELL|nr:FAD-dependent oxidoreductase [Cellulomonas gelida]GEA85363.1 pyridine nucleotide-disulfide oxidoreductase [Cellulomonas gelida]GGL36173.1 pyridine nucleotide-disulfide oxidoreductase [Cellulomonas gelida]
MSGRVVVVGGGLAGAKTVEALRERGFDGSVVLLGAERERPYERPPLSKGYLTGSDEREQAFVHAPEWYAAHDVDLRLAVTVTAIDRGSREVVDSDGTRTGYDHLVLATGSEPRRLDVPGGDLDGVVTLRTLADSDRLREQLARVAGSGGRVVVVGGGWIGLEVAAAARTAGCDVTVLVRDPAPLLAVLGERLAHAFADLHREHGVDLRTLVDVRALQPAQPGGTAVGAVELADGTRLDAALVVVGIGATPRSGLARDAGLAVGADGGIEVDSGLRSSDPHVLAVGDLAAVDHPFLGERVRVEHWDAALHHGATAAATILGVDEPYDRLPYFFTDQYDLGMEYTGWPGSQGYDEVVVRGDEAARELVAFWLRQGRVVAGMNVNVWDVVDDVQALIRSRAVVRPERLADPGVPLADLAR